LPPLLRDEVCECCLLGDRTPLGAAALRFCRSGETSEYACKANLRFGVEGTALFGGLVVPDAILSEMTDCTLLGSSGICGRESSNRLLARSA
jgi:hypothetical protein